MNALWTIGAEAWFDKLLSNHGALFWICVMAVPITAILMGGISKIVTQVIRHRERMAMIQRGMDPSLLRPRDQSGSPPGDRADAELSPAHS